MSILVERATEDDYADICAIDTAHMGNDNRGDYLANAVMARHCVIAREVGQALGFGIINNSFFGNPFIELLIVHPAHRRRGVGEAMIRYIEKTCPSPKLFTLTNESNIPMQNLCEKLGFVRSGCIENLDEGDPEIIYFKRMG
jgi:ribosomal protein S18 acetylase RimI-like enzyme